jgi:hypothetical protein
MFVGNHIAVGEGSEVPSRCSMHPRKDERVYVDLVSGDALKYFIELDTKGIAFGEGMGGFFKSDLGQFFTPRELSHRIDPE